MWGTHVPMRHCSSASQCPRTLQGAGYTSTGRAGTAAAAGRPGAPAGGSGSAEQTRQLEERVHALLEQSALLVQHGEAASAVDAAKDAARKEQKLCAALEAAGQAEQVSIDLKFAVSLNLATAYHANGQLADALSTYTQIIRSRLFPQVGAGSGCRAGHRNRGQAPGPNTPHSGYLAGVAAEAPAGPVHVSRPLCAAVLASS